MEVKDSADVVYDELMSTIAADLNGVRDLDDATKVAELSPKLNSAFDHAGIVIDKQVLDLYSVAMIQHLVNGNDNEITAADVTAFFAVYAQGAEDASATAAPAVLARMILELSALKDAKADEERPAQHRVSRHKEHQTEQNKQIRQRRCAECQLFQKYITHARSPFPA
jgi:hypothetical protein